MRQRWIAAAAALVAALALSACGTGAATATHSTPPSRPAVSLNQTTLRRVDEQIDDANRAIDQVNSDLDNPKPDS